ncbi:MAG: hypothetical protein K8T25_08355 [Planctomycetia bacterium]|nr:hypothetical protein [Planctomycetia bacterium]
MAQAKPSLTAPRPSHWRRLFQYRLRTLLILMAVIPPAIGWWSYKARQQREAVAAIRAAGGVAFYDFETFNKSLHYPAWLVDALGEDFFAPITSAGFLDFPPSENTKTIKGTDAALENFERLSALEIIDLDNSQITDAGLEHLIGLTVLKSLYLNGTKVTDAGLERLKWLTSLQLLDLRNTKVTDGGVARLQRSLPHCKIIR